MSHAWKAAIIGGLTAACLVRDAGMSPRDLVQLHVLDVGQGDALLLTTPRGFRILIDGGPDEKALVALGRVLPISDQHIDMIVLTHPHLDHLASLETIVRRGRTTAMMLSGPLTDGAAYGDLLAAAVSAGIAVQPSDPQRDLDLGDGLILDVLWPPPQTYGRSWAGDLNDASVTIAVRWHDRCLALLTGDLEEWGEKEVLRSGVSLRCDLLKVGHHGSRTSTSIPWLLAVQPRIAAVSVGNGNRFGHPHPEVIDRLAAAGIPVWRTDRDGTASFAWDADGRMRYAGVPWMSF